MTQAEQIISEENNSSEINNTFGWPARTFAHISSYLFHPLFVPLYVVLFLLYIHPTAFTGFSDDTRLRVVVIVIINVLFFPLLSVLLLKAVGFIDSIYLRNQKDRIIPYIASGIFFFWSYQVFKGQSQYPEVWINYLLGLFLASSASLIANIYFKVSMHAVGMGGWMGLFMMMLRDHDTTMTWPFAVVILITGLVSTSRLILKSHDRLDIYGGLLIGAITQVVAWVV